MFKITITGIDGHLLHEVEKVGKIEFVDAVRYAFSASFDKCVIKIDDDCVRIKNWEKRSRIILAKCEFEEINIE